MDILIDILRSSGLSQMTVRLFLCCSSSFYFSAYFFHENARTMYYYSQTELSSPLPRTTLLITNKESLYKKILRNQFNKADSHPPNGKGSATELRLHSTTGYWKMLQESTVGREESAFSLTFPDFSLVHEVFSGSKE